MPCRWPYLEAESGWKGGLGSGKTVGGSNLDKWLRTGICRKARFKAKQAILHEWRNTHLDPFCISSTSSTWHQVLSEEKVSWSFQKNFSSGFSLILNPGWKFPSKQNCFRSYLTGKFVLTTIKKPWPLASMQHQYPNPCQQHLRLPSCLPSKYYQCCSILLNFSVPIGAVVSNKDRLLALMLAWLHLPNSNK